MKKAVPPCRCFAGTSKCRGAQKRRHSPVWKQQCHSGRSHRNGDCSLSLTRIGDVVDMESSTDAAKPMFCLGSGLPALSKKMVAKILANEYIDISELPPARGKGSTMPQSLEG